VGVHFLGHGIGGAPIRAADLHEWLPTTRSARLVLSALPGPENVGRTIAAGREPAAQSAADGDLTILRVQD